MASQRPAKTGPQSKPTAKTTPRKGKHTSRRPAKRRPKKKRSVWVRILQWTLISLLLVVVAGFVGFAILYASTPLPDPNADFRTNTSFVYYNDGKSTLGSYQIQNRQSISYAKMSPYVVNAVIAAENRTFWSDPGISIPGMIRAGLAALRGEEVTGASTITQQYIKVLYLTQEKTLTRKLHEIVLAAKIGQDLPKQQIIEDYLNTVYFGRGAYGIEAASQAYFVDDKKKPRAQSDLTVAEAVALTCIINNPSLLDPSKGEKNAADLLERYQYTLNGMVEMNKAGTLVGMRFTEADRAAIYNQLPESILVKPKVDSKLGGPKGFLLNMVETELKAAGYSEEKIRGGGLRVVTTFDQKAQAAAVKAVQTQTEAMAGGSKKKAAELHGALASVDNETGGVLALYGGPDFVENSRNWATTKRPTGSTFKPYALTAALRNGLTLQDRFNGNSFTPPGSKKQVRNAGNRRYGQITLQQATTNSVNSAYVDLVLHIPDGPAEVISAANDAGVPTGPGWNENAVIALGGGEISPVDQALGYSTFANGGVRHTAHVVKEVQDAQGNVIYTGPEESTQALEEDVANDVTYALTKVASDGTGYRAAQLGYPVAGKTGTYYNSNINSTQAVWFVGFTKQVTTSVMFVKGDAGTADLGGTFGSGYPTSTWLDYMRVAMDGKERIAFDPPTRRVSTMKPKPKPTNTQSATPDVEPDPDESATPDPEDPSTDPGESTPPAPPSSPAASPASTP